MLSSVWIVFGPKRLPLFRKALKVPLPVGITNMVSSWHPASRLLTKQWLVIPARLALAAQRVFILLVWQNFSIGDGGFSLPRVKIISGDFFPIYDYAFWFPTTVNLCLRQYFGYIEYCKDQGREKYQWIYSNTSTIALIRCLIHANLICVPVVRYKYCIRHNLSLSILYPSYNTVHHTCMPPLRIHKTLFKLLLELNWNLCNHA